MHEITKDFSFCYSHRVWSQTVDDEFTCGRRPKCRHIHGHEGNVSITLDGDIQEDGMLLDFTWLQWFKHWIDEYVDHKFIVDVNDPLLDEIVGLDDPHRIMTYTQQLPLTEGAGNLPAFRFDPQDEDSLGPVLCGFVFVQFIPTSENLAAWVADIVAHKLSDRFSGHIYSVTVEWQETPTSVAKYTRSLNG